MEEDDDRAWPRDNALRSGSKYDFVKVKVEVEGDEGESAHFFILSRFLISRTLNSTKVAPKDAVRVALDLKKVLVAQGRLVISQAELERQLFALLRQRGYGDQTIAWYRMWSRFHRERRCLVVVVGGTHCVGKSTVATRLAEALNLPSVLQTDMIRHFTTHLHGESGGEEGEDPVEAFQRSCARNMPMIVEHLGKAMKEGKSVIVEGVHLDPSVLVPALAAAAHNTAAIVVPFLLTIDKDTHAWLSQCAARAVDVDAAQRLQRYLCEQARAHGVRECAVRMLPQATVDELHTIVLDTIFHAYNAR